MESTETRSPVFNLTVGEKSSRYLLQTARWAKFLAVAGMVMLVLTILSIVAFAFYIQYIQSIFDTTVTAAGFSQFSKSIVIFYVLVLGSWFFPLWYLLQFSNHVKKALHANDAQHLELSFQNLKNCFLFVGIVTLIFFTLYIIALILGFVSWISF